jgi:putative intracellular protease/amidase
VGARAAQTTGVRVLEATVPRELVRRSRIAWTFAGTRRKKRSALAAHHSSVQGKGRSARLLRVMLALPVPVFGFFFGREWFVEPRRSGHCHQR